MGFQSPHNEHNVHGASGAGTQDSGYFDIIQVGSTLTISNLNDCGFLVSMAAGTANGSVAVIEFDNSGCTNASCCYDEHFTETVALSGNIFSGEMRFTVDNTGCGTTSTPCEYTGTITATWCPPGTCLGGLPHLCL